MLVILGVIYFLLTLIGALILEPPKPRDQIQEILLDDVSIKDQVENGKKESDLLEQENADDSRASRQCPSLKTGLLSAPFIILFLNALCAAMFSIFLSLNFKTYGLQKVNDDHFVTFLSFLNGLASAMGRLFWGCFLDRNRFKNIYVVLELLLAIFTFSFSWVSSFSIVLFALWIFITAFIEGGLVTVLGPGLCKIFGMTVGPQLYPVKTLTFYLSLIFIPILQFFLLNHISLDTLFTFLALGNCTAFVSSLFLDDQYKWAS